MENTIFSEEYFREKVYSHVDNINLLYVALTRAKEELYAFIPSNATENSSGKLLWNAVADHVTTNIESERQVAEYGTKVIHSCNTYSTESDTTNVLIDSYPTTIAKMQLSLPQQRYFEEQTTAHAARNMGILMHSILCEATDFADVKIRIKQACDAGTISIEQHKELLTIMERELNREQVRTWFEEWDEVRNENDIIGNHIVGTRRPDRVMIKDNKAVVVDYKFGSEKLQSHQTQVKNYMSLLSEMGYAKIEGYIWYLSIGEIVKVES